MNNFRNTIKSNFSIVPNEVALDPNLSWKAKGIFLYLASKPDDWNFYMEEIQRNATDGITALRSGVKELIKQGYLNRYMNTDEDGFSGMIWELQLPSKTRCTENLQDGFPVKRKSCRHTNTNNTNTDSTNTDISLPQAVESEKTKEEIPELRRTKQSVPKEHQEQSVPKEQQKPSLKERNKKYAPLAKKLSEIVRTQKRIKHTSSQIKSWANEMRKLAEMNGVSRSRQKKALMWYAKNIGGEYIPEIESGASFRSKFTRLEDAMKRQKKPVRNTTTPSIGYSEGYFKKNKIEEEVW